MVLCPPSILIAQTAYEISAGSSQLAAGSWQRSHWSQKLAAGTQLGPCWAPWPLFPASCFRAAPSFLRSDDARLHRIQPMFPHGCLKHASCQPLLPNFVCWSPCIIGLGVWCAFSVFQAAWPGPVGNSELGQDATQPSRSKSWSNLHPPLQRMLRAVCDCDDESSTSRTCRNNQIKLCFRSATIGMRY